MRSIGLALLLAGKALQRLHMIALMPPFRSHGRAFRFDPRGVYTFQTISVGDNVNLGLRATMIASLSEIRMGDNIMFGPDVVVIGGGHSIYVLGEFMANVTEKSPTDDRGVVFEDDIWVGARAVILRGVTVGRGSVIAAGAVVTKNVPRFAVVAGNPARVLRYRWDVAAILQHEKGLYRPVQRTPEETLRAQRETHPPRLGG